MNVRKTGAAMLQRLFAKYLDLLRRTVAVRWDDGNRYGDSQIYGFWHEDSFFMNLVLERLAYRTTPLGPIRDPAAVEHGGRVGEKLRSGQKGLHSETARLTYCTRE